MVQFLLINSISRFSEVVEKFPALRPSITEHLIRTLPEIKSGKVYRGVLWILGEYVEAATEIVNTFQDLRKVIGEIPILAAEQRLLDEASVEEEERKEGDEKKESVTTRPKVLADGTYATETAYSSTATARLEAVKAASKPPLRSTPLSSGCSRKLLLVICSSPPWRRLLHWRCPRCGAYEACSSIF
jgi:vesicle coat complex subunit